jgi:hypothetical protein
MPPSTDPAVPTDSAPSYPPFRGAPGAAPPYGYPSPPAPGSYGVPMAPSNHGFAIASLVCSLLGVLFFPIIGSILGIVFGAIALPQIRASNGRQQGRGLARAGIIVGAVALVLWGCIFAAVIAVLNDPTIQQSIQ